MTASTQPESKSPSRRALLAGALGGLGAWAASAIGRASPVDAAAGDPIRMGRVNNAGSSATELHASTSWPAAALKVRQFGDGQAINAHRQITRWLRRSPTTSPSGTAVSAHGGACGRRRCR